MNKLTGKAKTDFELWFRSKQATSNFRFWMLLELEPFIINTLIKHWLDSVGIYLDRDTLNYQYLIYNYNDKKQRKPIIVDCYNDDNCSDFDNWVDLAINVACEIYNGEKVD